MTRELVRKQSEPFVCPLINLNDLRCASHFSLCRMDVAFDLCLRQHLKCVTFYLIL